MRNDLSDNDLSIKWHKIALYIGKIFDVILKTNIMRKCENMTRSYIEKKENFTKKQKYNMILSPAKWPLLLSHITTSILLPLVTTSILSQLSISIFQSYSFQCYLSRSSYRIASSSNILLKYIPPIYLHDIFYIHIFIQSHCQFLNLQQLNSSTKLWYVIAIKWTNIYESSVYDQKWL